MSKFLGESKQITGAVILVAGGGSSANSQPFSLKDVSRVSVVCQLGAAFSTALTTAVAPATVSVVCGTNGEASSMSVLTGATLVMGQATLGTLSKWDAVAISAHGTVATCVINIDGSTFHVQANATLTDRQLNSSACSAFVHSVVSAIATYCTHLETYGLVTAGNATATATIYVRRKDGSTGRAIDVSISNANAASSDCVFIQGIKQTGIIEFTPNDVLATNSSYTHFGVRVNSGVTTQQFSAVVIKETLSQPTTDINRVEI